MEFFMKKYNVFNTISVDFISNLNAENAIFSKISNPPWGQTAPPTRPPPPPHPRTPAAKLAYFVRSLLNVPFGHVKHLGLSPTKHKKLAMRLWDAP